MPRALGKLFDENPFQGVDQALQLRGQRAHLLLKCGDQLMLDDVPAAHDHLWLDTLYGAGAAVSFWLTPSFQKRSPAFLFRIV